MCCWVFTLFFFAYCLFWNQALQQRRIDHRVDVVQNRLILNPDEYQIDGDLLKISGSWVEGRQKVQAYYRIDTKKEKESLKKIATVKTLIVTGKAAAIQAPTNENQFDYRNFMLSKKVVNTIQISKLEVSSVRPNLGLAARIFAATHSLRKQILNHFAKMPAPLSGYSQILLLGYYAQNFSQQIEQINKLGLLHLFSLSGMHVFYLLGAIRFVLGYMHVTRETCDDVILLLLPFYAILGGLSSSLVRAVMMAWLTILSNKFWNNTLNGIDAEAIVLLLHLFYSPALVLSMGAQLSYLLTFVLMMGKRMSKFKLGLKMNGYSLPLILWHTFRWNILTIGIAILIVPLFEWVIIPSVLIGVLMPHLTFLCNKILFLITKGIEITAALPLNIVFGKPPLICVLFWIGLMFALEIATNKKVIYLMGLTSYLLIGGMIKFPLHDEIVFLDIGQGDCTLIKRRFNSEVTLIDTGGKVTFQTQPWQKRHGKENGETVVANYLLSKGVSRVDWLFLTHQDTDHVGNFPVVTKLIKVEKILVPSGMEKRSSFKKRLMLSANNNDDDVIPVSTNKIRRVGQFKILHPFEEGQGSNEDSITVTAAVNGVNVIISGDLDKNGELKICKKHPDLRADILKTGHHGSKTSTATEYVKQLRPQLAIISAGKNNRYGHPNDETLATLKRGRIMCLTTAEVGMIKLISNGAHKFRIETGNTLKAR